MSTKKILLWGALAVGGWYAYKTFVAPKKK